MHKFTRSVVVSRISVLSWLLWLSGLVALSGCGADSGPKRIPLSGKVTLANQPVKQGAISLAPAEGHRGVAANTAINDGRYQFTSEDGPGPGPYKVTILLTFTKEELLKQRQSPSAPQAEWKFEIKVPATGSPSEDFRLESK
ncbi:MAG: hypothetical protein ACKV2Q_14910 [Planctomycetaceae bacterium]